MEILDDSPAIMLDGMEGANLGIWCAHGEGRCYFPDAAARDTVLQGGLAPIRCPPTPRLPPRAACVRVRPHKPVYLTPPTRLPCTFLRGTVRSYSHQRCFSLVFESVDTNGVMNILVANSRQASWSPNKLCNNVSM